MALYKYLSYNGLYATTVYLPREEENICDPLIITSDIQLIDDRRKGS
jgi:hypothetical protein